MLPPSAKPAFDTVHYRSRFWICPELDIPGQGLWHRVNGRNAIETYVVQLNRRRSRVCSSELSACGLGSPMLSRPARSRPQPSSTTGISWIGRAVG